MSNTNEKAQDAYDLFHRVWGESKSESYYKKHWQELYSQLSDLISIPPFRLNPNTEPTIRTDNSKVIALLQERISELEAKYQRCEEALIEITKTDWTSGNGKYFGKSSAQLHALALNIAEQALKPKE